MPSPQYPHIPNVYGGLATTTAAAPASLTVQTGIPKDRTVRSVIATLQGSTAPGDRAQSVTAKVNADNSLTFYLWENTSGSDPTLVAATTAARAFYWLAIVD